MGARQWGQNCKSALITIMQLPHRTWRIAFAAAGFTTDFEWIWWSRSAESTSHDCPFWVMIGVNNFLILATDGSFIGLHGSGVLFALSSSIRQSSSQGRGDGWKLVDGVGKILHINCWILFWTRLKVSSTPPADGGLMSRANSSLSASKMKSVE